MCETGGASNSCNKSHVCTVSLLSKVRNVPKQISSPLWTGTLYQSHPMRAKLAATSEKQSLNVFEEYCWKRLCRGIKCVSRLWIYKIVHFRRWSSMVFLNNLKWSSTVKQVKFNTRWTSLFLKVKFNSKKSEVQHLLNFTFFSAFTLP